MASIELNDNGPARSCEVKLDFSRHAILEDSARRSFEDLGNHLEGFGDGVIDAGVAPSAEAPERPNLLRAQEVQQALDAAHIPYTEFKYSENTGQFQVIKEQTGTFSDSIKLWGAP